VFFHFFLLCCQATDLDFSGGSTNVGPLYIRGAFISRFLPPRFLSARRCCIAKSNERRLKAFLLHLTCTPLIGSPPGALYPNLASCFTFRRSRRCGSSYSASLPGAIGSDLRYAFRDPPGLASLIDVIRHSGLTLLGLSY
jgi:hypothetical protein